MSFCASARAARTSLMIALCALSALACKDETLKPPPGDPCVRNSDCKDPLSCTFGLCHEACYVARDCGDKHTCVKVQDKDLNVCQLSVEASCVHNSDCDPQLRCAADFQCRAECAEDRDCATKTQVCIDGVCAEPFDTMMPEGADAPVLKPRAAPKMAATAPEKKDAGSAGSASGGVGGSKPSSSGGAGAGGRSSVVNAVSACKGKGGLGGLHASNLPEDLELPDGLMVASPDCFGGGPVFGTNDATSTEPEQSGPHWVARPACDKLSKTQVVKLSDGREAAVLFVQSLTLNMGRTFSFSGNRPLIIVSSGRVEINGSIRATADAVTGWYGGGAPANAVVARAGTCPIDSSAGGGRAGKDNTALLIGPGGGGFCGVGGPGSTDKMGTQRPAGGESYGNAELDPLVGGSSGGSATADAGGYGGGALQIVSLSEIVIGDNGSISMQGGRGSWNAAGGSGGAILLEAPSVTVRGVLAANGGGGGGNSSLGEDGKPSDQPARGSATAGLGAAADQINGAAPPPDGNVTAGGGGAVGRIRINTGCGGKLTITSSAVVSPSRSTSCYSEGQLAE